MDTVIASLAIHSVGFDDQLPTIKECLKILAVHKLQFQVGPMSTIIEGPLHETLIAMEECRNLLHRSGVVKLEMMLTISSRSDRSLTVGSRMSKMQNLL